MPSPYQRKTRDYWEIVGRTAGQPPEVVDRADTLTEARYLVGEYRLAFGPTWQLTIRNRRERIER